MVFYACADSERGCEAGEVWQNVQIKKRMLVILSTCSTVYFWTLWSRGVENGAWTIELSDGLVLVSTFGYRARFRLMSAAWVAGRIEVLPLAENGRSGARSLLAMVEFAW